MFLDWLAAKDLEKAIHLDPNDFDCLAQHMATSTTLWDDWMHHNQRQRIDGRWMPSTRRSRHESEVAAELPGARLGVITR